MRIIVDLDQHQAVSDFTVKSAPQPLEFKSQDTIDFQIYFVQDGIVQDMGAGFALKFGMIKTGDATNTILAYQTTSSYLTDVNSMVYYQMQVVMNTSEMVTAIGTASSLNCTIELRYQDSIGEIIHSLNISAIVFSTILVETGVTPPDVSTGYPDASTIELLVHKGQPSGYAGLDSSGHILPAQLGGVAELVAHKDQPSGYPSLDSGTLIPAAEIPVDGTTIVVSSGKIAAPMAGGDMQKAVYDTNNDGIVDHAALADNATVASSASVASALTTSVTSAPISVVWGRDAAGNQKLFPGVAGGGDMLKATYDTNNDGVVDKAATLVTDPTATGIVNVFGKDTAGKVQLYPSVNGDMLKAVYDTNNDGIVDKAAVLRTDTGLGTLAQVWGIDGSTKQGLFTAPGGGVGSLSDAPGAPGGAKSWIYSSAGQIKKVQSSDSSITVTDSGTNIDLKTTGGAGDANLLDPEQETNFYDDFLTGGTLTAGGVIWTVSGGGSASSPMRKDLTGVSTTGKAAGTLGMPGGTGSNSYSGICRGANVSYSSNANDAYTPGLGVMMNVWRVLIHLIPTSTSDYNKYSVGLWYDNSGSLGVPQNGTGIFFQYDYNLNATNWLCGCATAGTSTVVDSGVAVVADTWFKLKILTDAAWSNIYFYINGTLVQTITTNIPPNTTQIAEVALNKLMVGTTQRVFYIDFVRTKYIYPR